MDVKNDSMEALEENAAIPQKYARRLKQQPVDYIFKQAEELYKQAMQKKSTDIETAYILFSRCMHACSFVHDSADFEAFRRGAYGRTFHRLYDDSMEQFERLQKTLDNLYAERRLKKDREKLAIAVPEKQEKPGILIDAPDYGNFIKPIQLIELVEEYRLTIIIVDYRADKSKTIEYTDTNFVRILPIDHNWLTSGLFFHHLRQNIDIRYRPMVQDIANVDLVVLLGDELADPDPTPFRNSSKTKCLLDVLTIGGHSPLARKPLLLEGGFPAWSLSYPAYVKSAYDNENMAMDLPPDIGKLINQVSNASKRLEAIKYPDLAELSIKQPSARPQNNKVPSPFPDSPYRESFESMTRQPGPRPPGPKHSVTHNIPVVYEGEKQPQIIPPKLQDDVPAAPVAFARKQGPESNKPPLVDRTNKPSNATATEFPVAFEKDPINRDVNEYGGARKDVPVEASPSIPSQREAVSPPTPDRNTKWIEVTSGVDRDGLLELFDRTKHHIHQMSEHGATIPGYTGLRNLGNTCFMNSSLQALFHTPGIRRIFSSFSNQIAYANEFGTGGVVSASFAALIDAMNSGMYRVISPELFLQTFAKKVNAQLADRRQHDAQEFQMCLLDALHEDMTRIKKRTPFEQNYIAGNIVNHAENYELHIKLFASSPIMDLFYLRSVSELRCRVCSTPSITFEEMADISLELPIDSNHCTLRECLKKHFGTTYLDAKWNCPSCKIPQFSQKSTHIWQLPPVLVICLKRFKASGGEFVKNEVNVEFELQNLDMSHFVHPSAVPGNKAIYQLYAIVNHDGRLNSGHYTSHIYQSGKWFKFDDDCVSECNDLRSQKTFILYYTNILR